MKELVQGLITLTLAVLFVLCINDNISNETFVNYSLVGMLTIAIIGLLNKDSRRKLLGYFIVIEDKQ